MDTGIDTRPKAPMRLLVTDDNGWVSDPFSRVDMAVRGGYTDLVVSVYHGSGARWKSKYLAWDTAVPLVDSFPALLAYAQYKGVRVWASFTCGIQQLPSLHPEWTYMQCTQWTRAFDWTNKDFRAWIAGLIEDFYKAHAAPGLFLDYIRFWDDLNGPLAGDDAARVAVVTDAVQQILAGVRAIKPDVLSMSFSNVDRLYGLHRSQGNDGRLWLSKSLVQHANCPAYDVDPRARLSQIAKDTADLAPGAVVPSISTYTNGLASRASGELLYFTEAQRSLFPHVSHYFYPTLSPRAADCLKVGL
jgi:hypothetical protein